MNFARTIRFSIIKFKRFCKSLKVHNEKGDRGTDGNAGNGATPDKNELGVIFRDTITLLVAVAFAGIFFGLDHKVLGLWASFITLAGAFHILFNNLSKRFKKREFISIIYPGLMLVIAVSFCFWTYKIVHPPPPPPLSPIVSPSNIQLATSTSVGRYAVTVFNPCDFPIFGVVVRIGIEQIGVPAKSIVIDPGKPPAEETNFGDIPVDFFRADIRG